MPEMSVPLPLTPDASINRVVLFDIPDVPIDDVVRGKSAFDLVGTQAVFDLIRTGAAALHLPPDVVAAPNTEAFIQFDSCFASDDATVRTAARQIARRFGRNLGYVLLALRRTDARREHRPEWDAWMRRHWWRLSRLWLGGGLIRGHLRDFLIDDIQSVFIETQTIPPALMLDPSGAALPLVGAACCLPEPAFSALVLDFGGTGVKRGIARYHNHRLSQLALLPALITDWQATVDDSSALRQFLFEFMIPTIATAWTQTQPAASVIMVSMAAYIDAHGQPCERQGSVYAALRRITLNLQQALSIGVSQSTGKTLHVILLHDGTAAAASHPGDAVMTFGTAIGIGYAPPVQNPLQLAADFQIT